MHWDIEWELRHLWKSLHTLEQAKAQSQKNVSNMVKTSLTTLSHIASFNQMKHVDFKSYLSYLYL